MVKCSTEREDREVCGEVSDASPGLGILHKSVGGLREPVAWRDWFSWFNWKVGSIFQGSL